MDLGRGDRARRFVVHPGSLGLLYVAVKPGVARIACHDGGNGKTIEVHDVARLVLRRANDDHGPATTGTYAPRFCLRGVSRNGTLLELGSEVEGVEFDWSSELNRVADHGMGAAIFGLPSRSCMPELWAERAGTATVVARWHGMLASSKLELAAGPVR